MQNKPRAPSASRVAPRTATAEMRGVRKRAKARQRKFWPKCAKVTLILGPKAAKAAFGQIWPKIAKVTHFSKPYYPPAPVMRALASNSVAKASTVMLMK